MTQKPEQSPLEGFDPRPTPKDQFFFAIRPPEPVALHVAGLALGFRESLGLQGQPLRHERLHIALFHLGDYIDFRSDIVGKATVAASSVSAAPFTLGFDRAESFGGRPGNHPFALRGSEALEPLIAFHRKLGAAMMRTGLGKWAQKSFTPHMTMLYDDRRVDAQPIDPVEWTAGEFVLVHGLLDKTQHVVLGRWPLRG